MKQNIVNKVIQEMLPYLNNFQIEKFPRSQNNFRAGFSATKYISACKFQRDFLRAQDLIPRQPSAAQFFCSEKPNNPRLNPLNLSRAKK